MAAKVVEEDAIFIALFFLIMGVYVATWGRRKGAQLARQGEAGTLERGASAQGRLEPLAHGQDQEPPHHRPPCSCPGRWLCGRPAPEGPEVHPGPSGWSTHVDPHGRAQWSSHVQRIYKGRSRAGAQGRKGLPPSSGCLGPI
jgi:hypothetical protein